MRALISKVVAGSMIAGAALMISSPKTETTTDNAMVSEMSSNESMDAMATDNMTATDGAMASNDAMMSSNDAMMSNDAMATNAQ
ncbi:MAG: hypothetical protein B7Y45_12610 [Sphingomonas sp. 28-66-16]|nr:MAG: hypothetical protein B7Y45_12610 [Sphingomonas sp. 28-66-16]